MGYKDIISKCKSDRTIAEVGALPRDRWNSAKMNLEQIAIGIVTLLALKACDVQCWKGLIVHSPDASFTHGTYARDGVVDGMPKYTKTDAGRVVAEIVYSQPWSKWLLRVRGRIEHESDDTSTIPTKRYHISKFMDVFCTDWRDIPPVQSRERHL